ncbi:MAG TPA: hypothetical protein PLJ21_07185 [Pseudobdellovibrionaceae bacterium]|nr:hypothetical protein [Pseudobdellovibrionaceae bacterium]
MKQLFINIQVLFLILTLSLGSISLADESLQPGLKPRNVCFNNQNIAHQSEETFKYLNTLKNRNEVLLRNLESQKMVFENLKSDYESKVLPRFALSSAGIWALGGWYFAAGAAAGSAGVVSGSTVIAVKAGVGSVFAIGIGPAIALFQYDISKSPYENSLLKKELTTLGTSDINNIKNEAYSRALRISEYIQALDSVEKEYIKEGPSFLSNTVTFGYVEGVRLERILSTYIERINLIKIEIKILEMEKSQLKSAKICSK